MFFISNIEQENVFRIFYNEETPLTHDFGPKMAISPTFCLGNIGQENVFYDILERKNAFQGYKNKSWKSRKIEIFSKGLTHRFSPKMPIFPSVFYKQHRTGKCL